MPTLTRLSLTYFGSNAEDNILEFYDAAEALIGFQRSIALTSHLVLNGQIISHAPALKGATVYVVPPEIGSWKITAVIISGIFAAGTAPKDTPAGHLIGSIYDYAVHQTLGFHVDYGKTLGQQLEEYRKDHPEAPKLTESKIDSLIEKLVPPFKQMHRPIVMSESALSADIGIGFRRDPDRVPITLDRETYDYVNFTRREGFTIAVTGRVSSYNVNTFKGRLFTFGEDRPIPFLLTETAQDFSSVGLITRSLDANAQSKMRGEGDIECEVFVDYSRTGIMKRLIIVRVVKAGRLLSP